MKQGRRQRSIERRRKSGVKGLDPDGGGRKSYGDEWMLIGRRG